jgi:signal transduction histidine kinase
MPKQVSALNTFLIVQYIEKNHPDISMQSIVCETNRDNCYFIENLKTGNIEPISVGHLSDPQYWLSNKFMIALYRTLEKTIHDPDLAVKIGRTFYHSQHILKIAIGIPFLGPYRLLERIARENRKYNQTKDIVLLKQSKGNVIIRVTHKSDIVINDFAMYWLVGVFESYARLSGATDVQVIAGCVDRGPEKYGDPGNSVWDFEIKFKGHSFFKRLFNSFLYRIPSVRTIIEHADEIQHDQNEQILFQEKIISKKVTLAEERERRSFAEDIHDTAMQSLAFSALKIKSMVDSKQYNGKALTDLQEIESFITKAIQEIRSVTFQICPPVLHHLGLEAALKGIVDDVNSRYGMMITFVNHIQQPPDLTEAIKILIYRSIRELITNIIKHAKTRKAYITLNLMGNDLIVSVEDSGIGFDVKKMAEQNSKNFGLSAISRRFRALQGDMEIYSDSQRGTHIILVAPLRTADGS